MGFMAAAVPFMTKAAGTAAASYGVNRGMEAAFGNDVQNSNMAPTMPQGPQGGPAMQILAQMQQQMQAEEQARQQALMALLTQSMGPPPQQPSAIQMGT